MCTFFDNNILLQLRIGQESDSDETESMAVPQSVINTAQSSENAQNAHALSDSNDEFPSDIDSFTGPLSKVVPTSMKMVRTSIIILYVMMLSVTCQYGLKLICLILCHSMEIV